MAAPSERRIAASQGIRYRGSGCRDHRCSLLTLPCILILPDQQHSAKSCAILTELSQTSMRRQSIQGATHKPSHHTRQSDNLWIGLDMNQFKAEPATMIHACREASPFAAYIEESIPSFIAIITGTCTCHKVLYVLCRSSSSFAMLAQRQGQSISWFCPMPSEVPNFRWCSWTRG